MANLLREPRTAAEWASLGQVIEFSDKVASFAGLAAAIEEDLEALEPGQAPPNWGASPVTGTLTFCWADAAATLPAVEGRVGADIDVVCQRCLEPFRLQLVAEPRLLLLEGDREAPGYDEFEVWELDDRRLAPGDIVDELLVMALPFAAMHQNMKECRAFDSLADSGATETTRPFAALREQMATDKENPGS